MAEQADGNDNNVTECTFPPGSRRVEYEDLDPAQKELEHILATMKHDPTGMGISHLGRDGIYRSLTADRDVVDAVPFPPPLVKAMLDRFPYNEEAVKESCLPPLEEEYRKEAREGQDDYRKWYEEMREKVEAGIFVRRAVCLMSDHDLGPEGMTTK
ncbi:hypothetical protein DER46DRAFT_629802 [Fusarium sp. MPI-SDFR-AT-0072]|nr:hypothetical protein DER46DRAFT_629802 [Fusarium sp. MPI-SDFR-AT-0072]